MSFLAIGQHIHIGQTRQADSKSKNKSILRRAGWTGFVMFWMSWMNEMSWMDTESRRQAWRTRGVAWPGWSCTNQIRTWTDWIRWAGQAGQPGGAKRPVGFWQIRWDQKTTSPPFVPLVSFHVIDLCAGKTMRINGTMTKRAHLPMFHGVYTPSIPRATCLRATCPQINVPLYILARQPKSHQLICVQVLQFQR